MPTADKRQAILKALEKVLKDRRFDEVTVDEVAVTAGVGKGTVYRYFQDKEDLFFQMVQQFLKEEVDAVAVVAASALAPRDKLIRAGETMSAHILTHGQYIRMLHGQQFSSRSQHGARELMHEHHERLDRILTQLLDGVEAAGVLRPGLDRELVLCIYKGMIMQRSMRLHHRGRNISVEKLLDLVLVGFGERG